MIRDCRLIDTKNCEQVARVVKYDLVSVLFVLSTCALRFIISCTNVMKKSASGKTDTVQMLYYNAVADIHSM